MKITDETRFAVDMLWCLSGAVDDWDKRHKRKRNQIGREPEPSWLVEARKIIRKATDLYIGR